jgi:hypothetical protein
MCCMLLHTVSSNRTVREIFFWFPLLVHMLPHKSSWWGPFTDRLLWEKASCYVKIQAPELMSFKDRWYVLDNFFQKKFPTSSYEEFLEIKFQFLYQFYMYEVMSFDSLVVGMSDFKWESSGFNTWDIGKDFSLRFCHY